MNEFMLHLLKSFVSGIVFGLGLLTALVFFVLIMFNTIAPYIKEFLTNIN